MAVRIQICGRVVAEVNGRRVEAGLPGRQGPRLLAYLAAHRTRAASRDELVEALWSGDIPPKADAALSVLLSRLRGALGPGALQGRSELRLAPPGVRIDLEDASLGVHRAESAIALGDWAGAAGPARVALCTSARGVLPGQDAPWIDELRRRVEDVRTRALTCVVISSLHIGGAELPAAERAARTLVALAPYRESAHRLLMETLVAQGDGAEALRVYDVLRRRLRDELGSAPGAELRALHIGLLGARLPMARRATPA